MRDKDRVTGRQELFTPLAYTKLLFLLFLSEVMRMAFMETWT